jgi:acetylornithine deacetylase/succinyl-diaminopimelate desuccinylase family protein
MSAVIELLRSLVRVNTENPPGNELELAEVLADWLRRQGIAATIDEFEPGRANLTAQARGSRRGRTLMLNTHMDVVPAGAGWAKSPFGAELEDGVIHGRGAADSKGSLAAMAAAMVALANDPQGFPGVIQLGAVADEEVDSRGVRRLLQMARPEAVIVGEPTELRLMTAHKGSLRPVVEVVGRSAHAALPDRGLNAVEGVAALLARLGALRARLERRTHPLVGRPTVVPVLIAGGEAPNMVPRSCRVTFDRRLVPGEAQPAVIAEFEAWLADFEHESGGMTARIVALAPSTGGPSETAAEHSFVRACQAGLAKAGLSPELAGLIVNCDMTHFRGAGIPAVVCGPGSPEAMHVRDEHLAVEALERAVTAYTEMARHWLAGGAA